MHGSWQLARTLHDLGLVDEYRLLVFPVVVGAGKRLFAEGAVPSSFTTVRTETLAGGAAHVVLRRRSFSTGEIVVEGGREVLR